MMSETEDWSRTVKTFVMFDTEATGLPSKTNSPKITELCFIALSRDELTAPSKDPRVVNKLLLCFNPQKQLHEIAASKSGLNNVVLEANSPFESHASLICSFLTTLPQPACLVAHNGNSFDFPLIVAQLNIAGQLIPGNILCADSIPFFRASYNREGERIDPDSSDSAPASKKPRIPDSETVQELGPGDSQEYSPNKNSSQGTNGVLKKRISFSLDAVCERMVDQEAIAGIERHTAEADCKRMLCAIKEKAEEFCRWCDTSAKPLINIKPMY